MTESRGHISDKREKGRHSPVVPSVCVSIGIRVWEKQHGVRYTCVVKGSISSHDLCCVASPLDWSPAHGPASLYWELAKETENNLYWTCTVGKWKSVTHCFCHLNTFWCLKIRHKKTYWHTSITVLFLWLYLSVTLSSIQLGLISDSTNTHTHTRTHAP